MTTTTVRLPEELKARLDKLAASDGKSTHAFMVEALARTADLLERQRAFDAEVQQRLSDFRRTGQVVLHEDMKTYALALAAGKKPKRPKTYAINALPEPRRRQ